MDDRRLLQLRPSPKVFEAPAGYLLRAFTCNGFTWDRSNLARRGIKLSTLLLGHGSEHLAKLTDHPASRFDLNAPHQMSKKRLVLRGQVIDRRDYTTSNRRWCPGCWADDLASEENAPRPNWWAIHHRFWWDVTAISSCPIHGFRLEDRCPTCDRKIDWRAGLLTTCKCGASLLIAPGLILPEGHREADNYILGRLDVLKPREVPLLDNLPLNKTLDAMERLGAAQIDGPFGALSKIGMARRSEVLSEGLRITLNWPENFIQLLKKLSARSEVGHWGVGRIYGYLYLWAKQIEGPIGDAVRMVMAELYSNTTTVKSGSMISELSAGEYVSLAGASRRLRCTLHLAYAALGRLNLLPPKSGKGIPIKVHVSDIPRISALVDDLVELRAIPEIFGCSKKDVLVLLDSGFLQVAFYSDQRKVRRHYFKRTEISERLEECCRVAPFMSEAPPGAVPFAYVRKLLRPRTLPQLLDSLIKGELKAVARVGSAGLSGLFIEFGQEPIEDRRNLMQSWAAAKYLGIQEETIYALVKAGLLGIAHAGRFMRFPKSELDRFRKLYVASGELAKNLQIHPSRMRAILKRLGVEPALSRASQARCHSSIFLRAQISMPRLRRLAGT